MFRDLTFATDASERWGPVGKVPHSLEYPVRYYLVLVPLQRS